MIDESIVPVAEKRNQKKAAKKEVQKAEEPSRGRSRTTVAQKGKSKTVSRANKKKGATKKKQKSSSSQSISNDEDYQDLDDSITKKHVVTRGQIRQSLERSRQGSAIKLEKS